LGRLPLDPQLAERCDAGEIERYEAEDFLPVAEAVKERIPEEAREPIPLQSQGPTGR